MKKPTLLEYLEPPRTRAEEVVFGQQLLVNSTEMEEDDRILIAYLLEETAFGRLLLARAKSLQPSLIVEGETMEVGEILSILDEAYTLGQLLADEEFGVNPDVHHWEHCGGYASDKLFESLIAMAKGLEKSRRFSKEERERVRVVRKRLEKERDWEIYVTKRDPRDSRSSLRLTLDPGGPG